jgi:hypothetical protein
MAPPCRRRTLPHKSASYMKSSMEVNPLMRLREEWVLVVAMVVALVEAGQPYVPSVDSYAE